MSQTKGDVDGLIVEYIILHLYLVYCVYAVEISLAS